MTSYTDRYTALTAQRAYTRAVAAGGLSVLLAPYALRVPVVPSQRRRVVAEVVAA